MVVGVLFGVLAICLLLTVPIAVSLGIATIAAGFSLNAVTGNQMLTMLAQTTITASDNTSLLAMPFFMLCGSLMDRSGIAKRLIDVAEAIVGEATGGLGATTIVAAMLFAAISGSGPACVAALGGILIPAMVRRGYSTEYAAATTASAGTIGPVIPPSIPMIVYAVSAGTSVTALFLGGVGPGVLMGLIMILYNFLISKKRGYKGTPRGGGFLWVLKQIWKGLPALLMPVIVLGGIYSGLATPTESAVLGVIYTLIVGFFVFRTLNFKLLKEALVEAAMMSAPVMFLLGGAAVFGRLLTLQRIPEMLATAMLGLSSSKYVVMPAGRRHVHRHHVEHRAVCPAVLPHCTEARPGSRVLRHPHGRQPLHRLPDAAAWRQPVRRKEYIRCAIGRVGQRTDAIHRHPRSGARPDGLLPADRHVPAEPGRRMTPDTQELLTVA